MSRGQGQGEWRRSAVQCATRMHFWANDDAKKLASGLRATLDKVNVVKQ